jgi:outer membrane protein OmpA-like peptidoglycan-associated protein/tetratricopeptide (TPR) repeat protein
MKKIYTILLLIVVSTAVATAQNKKTKKADVLYERLAYTDAAAAYQKLLKKGNGSRYVFERLANSYYFINDTKKAEPFYKRVVKGRKVNAETVYNYAQCLKANGKFADYNTWMQKFSDMRPNDSRAVEFMKNPNYIPTIMEGVQRYGATNAEGLNSKYSDFGGIVSGKDFYFASGRNTTRKTYQWNDEPFLDIYKANLVGGTIKDASLVTGDVNTKYHESNPVISADGKRMYFDRNDFLGGDYEKSSEGINQINLYYAEKMEGGWRNVTSAPFNSSEYSTGHPALSPDGKTLYFVSDMPGGKGGSDIYKVAINANGSLGTPMRLGNNINTEGKEVFPYVDSNGTLYFSSDAHLGIGGLDVFYAEAQGNDFGDVKNMGKGVNSAEDDFAFKFDGNTREGFVSSNRQGGKGSDDIYMIKELELPCVVTIDVKIIDEYSRAAVSGARVDMYDAFENKLSTKTSDANGLVTFDTACDKEHVIQAVAPDYESDAVTVAAANDTKVNTSIELRPIEAMIVNDQVELEPIFFDYNKHNIKPQAAFELDKLVALMKKYPTMVIAAESHTDNRGNDEYNMELSERRAQATVQYIISQGIDASRISGKGFGESKPTNTCGEGCSEEEHQKNRRSEFNIVSR